MKNTHLRRKFTFLLVTAAVLVGYVGANAQTATPWSQNNSPLPPATGFVNDYAGVVDASTKQQLETKLKNLKDTTNPQVEIAVAVVKTTGDRDIFDYSLAVARGWGIGSKADDNPSALLFVAIDDRKYFTQVSKDLEDELPDSTVGSLQRQYLVPEFKKGNYGKGISDTIDAYINAIRNKGNSAAPQQTPAAGPVSGGSDLPPGCGIFCCSGVLLLILLVYFLKSGHGGGGPSAKDRSRWGGGGFGGTAANVATSALPWIIGSILSGGGGSSCGSSDSSWGGSSGGSDWGGFGGGGDFGGGGSGGSW
jgi:uncharacterized protein